MFKPKPTEPTGGAGWYQVEGEAADRWGNFIHFGWRVFAGNPEAAGRTALLEMGRLMLKSDPIACQGTGLKYIPGREPTIEPCSPPWTYFTPEEGWNDEQTQEFD